MVIYFYFFLAFFLPFIWVIYFFKQDKHPEPFLWLLFAFLLGISAAFLSYYFEGFLFLSEYVDSKTFLGMLSAVFIEEFFKFFMIWVFIYPQKVFDEPIDAMIYMMFSALGFASIENIIGVSKLIQIPEVPSIFLVLFYRFLGANLLHILSSSLIGYGYASWINLRKPFDFFISFIAGVSLHFIYNYIIINLNFGLVLPVLWAVFLVVLNELDYLTFNGRREKRRNLNS